MFTRDCECCGESAEESRSHQNRQMGNAGMPNIESLLIVGSGEKCHDCSATACKSCINRHGELTMATQKTVTTYCEIKCPMCDGTFEYENLARFLEQEVLLLFTILTVRYVGLTCNEQRSSGLWDELRESRRKDADLGRQVRLIALAGTILSSLEAL